ncbi:MAG: hypothetical protein ACH349_01385 [Candidatus Rhabdochlamydia sp.]
MILSLPESLDLGDWLYKRGLGLGEVADVLCDIECGDTFALALKKAFFNRKKTMEKVDEKKTIYDWGNPITP